MSYSLETLREVWDDRDGQHIEIGPDRDGLDMVELRDVAPDGKIDARMSFTVEAAALVARAMLACVDELKAVDTPVDDVHSCA